VDDLAQALDELKGAADVLTDAESLPSRPDGCIRFILHLEGCKPLEGDLSALHTLYRLGVRSAQLTWNVRNEVADGVMERRTGGGLSRFGVEVVQEMNRLGMVVDLAHIAEAGFWQTLEVAQAPVVVTHANARAILDHPRNLSDDQLRAIGESGGVVGAHCLPAYVDPENRTLDRLIDHVLHMAEVIGIERVGLGPDFPKNDGPRPAREQRFARKHEQLIGLEDVDQLPVLTAALLRRGLTEDEVAGVLGGNFIRVLREVIGDRDRSENNI
jgi:membrane dipeptidase